MDKQENILDTKSYKELEEMAIEKYEAPPKKSYRSKPYNKYLNAKMVQCGKCGTLNNLMAFDTEEGKKYYCKTCFYTALNKVKESENI